MLKIQQQKRRNVKAKSRRYATVIGLFCSDFLHFEHRAINTEKSRYLNLSCRLYMSDIKNFVVFF